MTAAKTICIAGTGGFAREVHACLLDSLAAANHPRQPVCFMEKDEHFGASTLMGLDVIRQSQFDPSLYSVLVAIGNPAVRKKVVAELPADTNYYTLIHPGVVRSKWVEIGPGSIVTAGTILTTNIVIGRHAHLNLHTTVGHDCRIGDFFTTAPAVNISGNCTFGDCVYLGTNAAIREGISICSNVTVGMGGIVLRSITEPGTYVGMPVKRMDAR
jgi:sugar O-acyltransferase (sialic acid O-acetyltransferase NeuD family)